MRGGAPFARAAAAGADAVLELNLLASPVPPAVAQEEASSLGEIEAYLNNKMAALSAIGIPACATLLVLDGPTDQVGQRDC